jgi:hypothetical protein
VPIPGTTKLHRLELSVALQSVAPGNSLEFDADNVLDWNHGSRLELKCFGQIIPAEVAKVKQTGK